MSDDDFLRVEANDCPMSSCAAPGMGTLAVIDNAFLPVVVHQQGKIDGSRASGMHSARAYINASLEATAPGVAIILVLAGAFLGSCARKSSLREFAASPMISRRRSTASCLIRSLSQASRPSSMTAAISPAASRMSATRSSSRRLTGRPTA